MIVRLAKQLPVLGIMLVFAAFLLRKDVWPDGARFGHWFWIAIGGFLLYALGSLFTVWRKKRTLPSA